MREDKIQRMREEHLKVDALSRSLRERVAGVPSLNLEHWIPELRKQFESFRAHGIKHMAFEELDGYMAPVVERRPGLALEVERLQHEHGEFIRILDGIHQLLEDLTSEDRLLVRDCCNRINNLLDYVDHHEKDENLLITFAFTQDIGTND